MTRVRFGMLPFAVLAMVATGCGTQRAGDVADAYHRSHPTPTGISKQSAPTDFPCPGESPSAAPKPTPDTPVPTTPPTDHYVENHGFMVPFPLHGQLRCDGLVAVKRIQQALEPLRRRGDFAPESTHSALTALGYTAGAVKVYQSGPTGVGFLIDASRMCVEGTMDRASTHANTFDGYPDHPGCDRPSGGH
ncbi:hypothetical protein [Peterkaempfera sp. SMS 1(5)a]|uniref:hypothetical protein n=1 Tax=Peterkaempfera podocarpi TaxID=3232308 RepID=UPI0036730697